MQVSKARGAYKIQTDIVINCSKQKAWALLSEFDSVYKWIPNISASHGQGKQKVGVGHGRHCVIDGFGAIDETITLWSEGEGFEFEISPVGPLYGATSRWELREQASKDTILTVTLVYSVRFGVFGKMMHKMIMRKKLTSNLNSILKTVKSVLEDEQSSSDLFSTAVPLT